jgi:hypothetical protein
MTDHSELPLHITNLSVYFTDTVITFDTYHREATYDWERFGDGYTKVIELDQEECDDVCAWWRSGNVEEIQRLCHILFPFIADTGGVGAPAPSMDVVARGMEVWLDDQRIAKIDVYDGESGATIVYGNQQWDVSCNMRTARLFGDLLTLDRMWEADLDADEENTHEVTMHLVR